MKQLLNTLYVTTQGAYLAREGETVLVRHENETRAQIPIHTIGGIVCFGRVSCSPPLMGLCGERKVALSFMSLSGRFLAKVNGPVSGNVLLRRAQYRMADDTQARAALARSFVAGKIANCRSVLLRSARDHSEAQGTAVIEPAARRLGTLLTKLQDPLPLDTIRGMEGDAAREYFGVFDNLILSQKAAFFFHTRTRRPPLDNTNSVLSFLYTMLAHDTTAALESVGLDPAVGYLHSERPGRPSLALDLMEEFRPLLADRLALSLINRNQISEKGFSTTETGGVLMNDTTRKELITAYQKRKQDEITHPFLHEKAPVGMFPFLQAALLARFIRGDIDAYPPFFWK